MTARQQAPATAPIGDVDAPSADLDALAALNRHYIRSVAEADVGWFARHLSDDFLNTNPDGRLVDRTGFLAQVAPPSAVPDISCEDVRIRLFGDTALIHARTRYTMADGRPGAGRYTDIWVRRDGRWHCVAAHVTRS